MSNHPIQKSWVSPITALSFAAVAITGLLMLLHIHFPGIKAIHDWMGVVLCVAGLVHLWLNGRVFLAHFRHRAALGAVAAGVVLLLAALFVPAQDNHGGRGSRRAAGTMEAPQP